MPRRRSTRSISLVAALLLGPVAAGAVAVTFADPLEVRFRDIRIRRLGPGG